MYLTMPEIYTRVENLLAEKHLRKVDLSNGTGISDSSIRSWQSGVIPNIFNAYKVAKFLDITVEELVTGKSENQTVPKPQKEQPIRLSYMEEQLLNRFNSLDERDRDILLTLADVMVKQYRGLYSDK